MINFTTPHPSTVEKVSYGEIAAIEDVLKTSFEKSDMPAFTPMDDKYLDLSADIVDLDDKTTPCFDHDHYVSLIDVTGPSAAAIVEFTDCSGALFSDMYVLEKRQNQWAISQKVWDSHANS